MGGEVKGHKKINFQCFTWTGKRRQPSYCGKLCIYNVTPRATTKKEMHSKNNVQETHRKKGRNKKKGNKKK